MKIAVDAGITRSTLMIAGVGSGIVAGSICWTILFTAVVGSDIFFNPLAVDAELSYLKGWAGYVGTAIFSLAGAAFGLGFAQYLWIRGMHERKSLLIQPDCQT